MKQLVLFIHKDRPDMWKFFRDLHTAPDGANVYDYDSEYRELTPIWNKDYTFRVRSKGKTYKGYVTTQGDLVVRTYKDYNR